ncbi:hypothetical protein FA13DRAFT_1788931 [Coprinellus micaceus]|uniref:Transmembrane protein n=1 Tax=Coprinellus micaceus TaxID=71717 RepID=A0A4Y7TK05_COPMI|nr:hypothetical protein FA13DRAFT_1788931 [Coprinellus micaceus]
MDDAAISLFTTDELVGGLAHKYIILISTSEWDRVFKALLIESHDDVDASPPIDSDSLPRFTAINVLFYLNRYLSLLGPIGFLLQALWLPPDHPHKLQLVVGVFLVVRTYALYNGNKCILWLLVISAAAVLANGVFSVSSHVRARPAEESVLLRLYGCSFPMDVETARKHATAWAGLLGLDLLIFALTLYKSITEIRYGGSTIMRVLLRDGAIYFGLMAILTSMTMATFLAFGPYYRGIIVTFTNAISSVMMARLLLNLRDPSLCCRSRYVPGTTGISVSPGSIFTDAISLDEEHQHTVACRERHQTSQELPLGPIASQQQPG